MAVPYNARNAKRAERLRRRLEAGEQLTARERSWLERYTADHPRGVYLMARRAARASTAASDPHPPDAGFDSQERTDDEEAHG